LPLDLTEAGQLKTLIVDPVVDALRFEMRAAAQPLVEELSHLRQGQGDHQQRLDQLDQRVGAVERFKMRIAAVCSGIAIVTGMGWRMALDWIRSHLSKTR
jgi:hypothetical protein